MPQTAVEPNTVSQHTRLLETGNGSTSKYLPQVTVKGEGTDEIGKIRITNGTGTMTVDNEKQPAVIYERIPWSSQGLVLYQGIAFADEELYVFWVYTPDDSNSIDSLWIESTGGLALGNELGMGSVNYSGTEKVEVSYPSFDLNPPTSDVTGPEVDSSLIQITGDDDYAIINGLPERTEIIGGRWNVSVFETVDCMDCGPSGWYEYHALVWSEGVDHFYFTIFYHYPNKDSSVTTAYTISFPGLKEPRLGPFHLNEPSNQEPVPALDYDPSSPELNQTITFDALKSEDPDGNIRTYGWDFDGDGIYEATGPTATWTFESTGNRSVTLRVTDYNGATATTNQTLRVTDQNAPPIPAFTTTPSSPMTDQSVTFDAGNSTDSDGTIQSYEWDFDSDGDTDATGVTATHTYTSAGTYSPTLTVTDDQGATDSISNSVTVESDNQNPASVGVELQPTTAEVPTNSTHTVDVVATNVTDGIGSYNLTVAVNDTSVATISNVSLNGDPLQGGSTDIVADGSSVIFTGSMTDTKETGEVTIATLTLTTQSAGAVATTTTVKTIGNESGFALSVSNITETTVAITDTAGPPAVIGNNRPSDTDGDGAFEDINGDDEFDVNDVTALWANRNTDAVTNNPQAFDINGDGEFDVNDVTALWNNYLTG